MHKHHRKGLEGNRRLRVNGIANEVRISANVVGISYGSTFGIVADELMFGKVCARWVACLLTIERNFIFRRFMSLWVNFRMSENNIITSRCPVLPLNQNKSARSGDRRDSLDQNKPSHSSHLARSWQLFSAAVVCCTLILCRNVGQSTQNNTPRF